MPAQGLDKIFRAARLVAAPAPRPAQCPQCGRERQLVDPDEKYEQRCHARGGKIESRRTRSNHSPLNSSNEASALAGLAIATTRAPAGNSERKSRINSRSRRRTLFLTTAPPTRFDVMIPALAGELFSRQRTATLRSRPCATRPFSRTREYSQPSRRRASLGKRSLFRSGFGVAGKMDFDTLRQKALASPLATTAQNGAAGLGRHARAETKLLLARAFGRLVGAFHKMRSVEPRKLTNPDCQSIPFPEFLTGYRRIVPANGTDQPVDEVFQVCRRGFPTITISISRAPAKCSTRRCGERIDFPKRNRYLDRIDS